MKLAPHELTFIAEALGRRQPPPLRWIVLLAGHTSAVVREGAVYGMALHAERCAAVLQAIAMSDPNEHVRNAAREALE